jgi:hypothetical protein
MTPGYEILAAPDHPSTAFPRPGELLRFLSCSGLPCRATCAMPPRVSVSHARKYRPAESPGVILMAYWLPLAADALAAGLGKRLLTHNSQ